MADAGSFKVQLYLYDLSQGMVKNFSRAMIGKQIDGIWHTGVVIHFPGGSPREWFYGGGIQVAPAGCTQAGRPVQVIEMGFTQIPLDLFNEFLREISPNFTPAKYSLLKWNCNNFSDEVCKFLLGKPIPAHITGLPAEVLATPIGQMFLPMITQMENQMKGGGGGSSFLPGWEGGQAPASNAAPITAASAAGSVLPQPTQAAAAAASASASASASAPAPQAPAIARSNSSSSVDAPTALSALCSASHRHRSLIFSSANTSSVGVSTRPLLSLDDKAAQFKDMLLKQNATIAAAASGAPLSATELDALEATISHLRDNPKDSVAPPPHEAIALFVRLATEWPVESLFPVLALFRLLVARPSVAEHFAEPAHVASLRAILDRCVPLDAASSSSSSSSSSASAASAAVPASAQLMALCAASNLFARAAAGRVFACDEAIVRAAKVALASKAKVLKMMGATLMFNISLHAPRDATNDAVVELLSALHEAVVIEKDFDALSRMLSALAHLIYCNDDAVELLTALDLPAATAFDARAAAAVADIHAMLASQ